MRSAPVRMHSRRGVASRGVLPVACAPIWRFACATPTGGASIARVWPVDRLRSLLGGVPPARWAGWVAETWLGRSEVSAAGGIVLRKAGGREQVLVIRRRVPRDWTLPKGRLEAGEDEQRAALR